MIQGTFWKMGQKRIHEPEDFIVRWCLLVTLEVILVKSHPHVHPNVNRRCQQPCPTPWQEAQEANPIQRTIGNRVKLRVGRCGRTHQLVVQIQWSALKTYSQLLYGLNSLYLGHIHACSNNERKGHEFEGGEKG